MVVQILRARAIPFIVCFSICYYCLLLEVGAFTSWRTLHSLQSNSFSKDCNSFVSRSCVDVFNKRATVLFSSSTRKNVPSSASPRQSKKQTQPQQQKPTEDSSILDNTDHPAEIVDNEQLREWEEQEIALQRAEAEDTLQQLQAEGKSVEDIPAYMLSMLKDFQQTYGSSGDGINGNGMIEVPAEKLPIIAVIGRPNTGKSTVSNRLTNSYKDGAIVHDEAGITRDRTYRTGEWCGYHFQVVDTGGIIFDDSEDIFAERITQQALVALAEATAAILVCDGQQGLTQLDEILADWLRKHSTVPLYLAVNKCESEVTGLLQAQEFWSLGLGEPRAVSGIHGNGIGELLDDITSKHMSRLTQVLPENVTNVALVGRPNVGKSSLFNKLYGQERAIVSDVAGTTRDAVDALVSRGNSNYRVVDTAGIRKKGKVQYGAEFFMVNRAFKAIKRAEVVVLLLDASAGLFEQDRILAQRINDEGRSCVIALNKWDAVDRKDDKSYIQAIENVREHCPTLKWAEVVLISATTGQRVEKLFGHIDRAARQFKRRVSTAVLNEVVSDATLWLSPPTIGSRAGRIYYCLQISTAPPTLVFFCNDPALFTDTYQRYLERKIRDSLDFEGTPIRMIWRGKTVRDVSRAIRKGALGSTAANVLSTGKERLDENED